MHIIKRKKTKWKKRTKREKNGQVLSTKNNKTLYLRPASFITQTRKNLTRHYKIKSPFRIIKAVWLKSRKRTSEKKKKRMGKKRITTTTKRNWEMEIKRVAIAQSSDRDI